MGRKKVQEEWNEVEIGGARNKQLKPYERGSYKYENKKPRN